MKLTKAGVRLLVGIITTLGFFAMIGALMMFAVPTENGDILKILVGFIGGAFMTIIAFYFGDSDSRPGS